MDRKTNHIASDDTAARKALHKVVQCPLLHPFRDQRWHQVIAFGEIAEEWEDIIMVELRPYAYLLRQFLK